jgi:hypothetical protein
MIINWLKSAYSWLQEQLQAAWSRLQGQGPEVLDRLAARGANWCKQEKQKA